MAWYYVKEGGTATGDGGRVTSQRTGTWSVTATEYYDNIGAAIAATTVPTDGDFILVSDLHAPTGVTSAIDFNASGAASGAGLSIVSVDDSNQENYKPGASEVGQFALDFRYNGLLAGVSLSNGSSFLGFRPEIGHWVCQDGLLDNSRDLNAGFFLDAGQVRLINMDIGISDDARNSGCNFVWQGGTFVRNHDPVFSTTLGGGGHYLFEGVDLSAQEGSIQDQRADLSRKSIVLVRSCLLSSILTLPSSSLLQHAHHVTHMRGSDDSSGDDNYRLQYATGLGSAVNDESVFVTATRAWSGHSDKSSILCTNIGSHMGHARPFIFDLPMGQRYLDIALGHLDVLRIPITSNSTWTDTEIAAFLLYPDSAVAVRPNWATSGKTVGAGNYGVDPLAAGATLPTSSVAWTGAKTNKYYLELDTSADPGQVQALGVRIEIYKSDDVYIGTEFEAL